MICIDVKKNWRDEIVEFHCEGHAEYDEYGQDIICSAISILTLNCMNSIEALTKVHFVGSVDEEGAADFVLNEADWTNHDAQLLLQSMVLGMQGISETYGKKYVLIHQTVIEEVHNHDKD